MKTIILMLLAFHLSYVSAESSRRDLLWRARGLQAIDKMEKLAGEYKKTIVRKRRTEIECEMNLERLYAAHAVSETMPIVSKTIDGKNWRLLLWTPDEGATQISLLFEGDALDSDSWKVPTIGKGWSVSHTKKHGVIMVQSPKCGFIINPDNPLESRSIAQDI